MTNEENHGLSHRYNGSHHHEWDLWARILISERHIRWQIWHSKLLVDGGPDLRRSLLASNSWMRRTSNSSTADLHVKRQPVLFIASVSSSEGVMPHWVIAASRRKQWSTKSILR